MDLIRRISRRISPLVVAAFTMMSLYVPATQAGMIAPSAYAQQSTITDAHQQLQQFLDRTEVRAQLVELGVDPHQAQARVQSMSAAEASLAAQRLQQLPAGGDGGLVGALVFIFVLLLITDLLGLTDVYPFVRN